MVGKGIMTAIFAVLLTATAAGGFGGGGGGFGGAATDLLLPGSPTHICVTPGNGEVTVSFNAPKSDGGYPIRKYTVISHPGKIKASGKQSPITVKGLTNGKYYTFTVEAVNSIGTGIESEPSPGVFPKAE